MSGAALSALTRGGSRKKIGYNEKHTEQKKLLKSYWLTAIFLHLPVRAEALRAALGTAGHHSFMKGFALHPFCDGGGVGNAPINCNLKHFAIA